MTKRRGDRSRTRRRPSGQLADFQGRLARAILSGDPAESLKTLARSPRLCAALRRAAASADPDGVRLSALLVKKLRFERLVRGDSAIAEWFEHSPRTFVQTFRDYEAGNPPRALFAGAEAAAFGDWTKRGARRATRAHSPRKARRKE